MAGPRVALITGIAGGLARLTGKALAERGYKIVGVDYRPLGTPLDFEADVFQANYNKTKIEDVFRHQPPDVVLHLGRVGNLKERMGKRFDLNVIGSRKVMDLTLRYEVKRLVILSTFHIYGAHPHNHIPISEDEPLRAGAAFPQIADAIQLDNQAVMWCYRHRRVRTALLRPCNVIGPDIHNAMSRFLRSTTVPVLMGFDPMVQFVHQQDLVEGLIAVAEGDAVGVFNISGLGTIPWGRALRETKARQIPVPSSLVSAYLNVAGALSRTFPPYLINFFKYPCVIADDALREAFDWAPKISQLEAIRSTIHR